MEDKKKIEEVSEYHKITGEDKQEGISIYGEKPLDSADKIEDRGRSARNPEVVRRELDELNKKWKSTDYVGDKDQIEREILAREEELRGKKLKTAKELAMGGVISWDKGGGNREVPKTSEVTSVETTPSVKEAAGEAEKSEKIEESKKSDANLIKSEATSPTEKEKKEAHSEQELLNAAEILCKYQPGAHKTPKEEEAAKKRALEGLKDFSEGTIARAVEVAGIRNQFRDLRDIAKTVKAEYKTAADNPSINENIAKAKYEQRLTNLRRQMRLLENDFDPALMKLKMEYLKSEGEKLKKYESHEDFKEKVKDLELSAFSMVSTEMVRWQDAEIAVNHTMNPTGWDHTKNFFSRVGETKGFQRYAKMGRIKRTALSAAVVGGATALLMPSVVAAAGIGTVGYMAWRGIRSMAGGTVSYWLSKKITQPFIKKAYDADEAVARKRAEGEATKTGSAADDLERLIRGEFGDKNTNETLEKIAALNMKLSKEYATQMQKNRKAFVRNNTIGTLVTGLIGGAGTAYAMEKLFAPEFIALIGGGAHASSVIEQTPGGGAKEAIPPAVGGGAGIHEGAAGWEFGTAKPGDSVWRVIEHDLQHNMKGFSDLPKAQQTYIIDHYKDLVVADPEKFGLHDPNLIQPGWGKEVHTLFEGKGGQAELDRWMGKAGSLTPEQMHNIEMYNMKPTVFHPDVPTPESAVMSGDALHKTVESIQPMGVSNNFVAPQHAVVMGSAERIFSRPEALLDLDRSMPHLADTAAQFPHLSLAEQEHVLSSPVMARITDEVHQLNHIGQGLTGSEVSAMEEVNKHWASMMESYTQNSRVFTSALHEATGLDQAGTHPFLSTVVDKVVDNYKGNDRVLEFMRTINPTSNELAAHVSVEEVLKNRFVDGHFGKVNLDQYISGNWKE